MGKPVSVLERIIVSRHNNAFPTEDAEGIIMSADSIPDIIR